MIQKYLVSIFIMPQVNTNLLTLAVGITTPTFRTTDVHVNPAMILDKKPIMYPTLAWAL